jgi:histidinol dehydrogenase
MIRGVQELTNELEDLKEKIERTGIERDNLLQEFRDVRAENMNVTRMEMESCFRKLNEKVMELEEFGCKERNKFKKEK